MKLKKLSILVLIFLIVADCLTYAAFSPENNIIADETEHHISPGLKYIRSIEVCEGVRQEIYSFEYMPGNKTAIVPAYGQYIYGFNSVGDLISSYDGNGRVVGGINTDFFITSTGIPLSCLVSDREIITSCDNRVAIGFDENGYAVIGNPSIKAELIDSDNGRIIPVAHINKTPGIWGLYLVNDKFSSTTRSSVDSTEIVLKPVTADYDSNYVPSEIVSSVYAPGYYPPSNGFDDINDHINIENENEAPDISSDPNVEDTYPENNIFDDSSYITNSDGVLRLGESLKTVVTEIRENSMNSTIPENCFVACIPNENFSYLKDGIQVGDEVIINLSYNKSVFSDSVNIFGAGSEIVRDGVFVEQADDSIFKYRNPRTAAGIKEDGTVVFVCVDGRRSGVSVGYTIKELADYLISKGCINAVNFDGGGSTTFYAADLGEVNTTLKNTPSDGRERRIADGLIFVNTSEPTGIPAVASVYPTNYYVYNKGTGIALDGKVLFADSEYYPVTPQTDTYSIEIENEFGIIENGIFTPSGTVGITPININYNGAIFEAGQIHITDVVDKFNITAADIVLDPFEESTKLSFLASLNTIPVTISGLSPDVSISIYNSDSDDGLIEVSDSEAYFDGALSVFIPTLRGVKYRISASLGGVTDYVDIDVEEYPFDDMSEHWGSITAYDMFKKGLFVGEIDADSNRAFYPERNMTKAEFCTVLARALNLDSDYIKDAESNENTFENGFENIPDWAKGSVLVLYREKYIDSLISQDINGNKVFNYDEYITRMDVIRVIGGILSNYNTDESSNEDPIIFSDFVTENDDDADCLNAVWENGIITGFEDGTIRQNNNLTRAQAAAVFSRFLNIDSYSDA